MSFRKVLLSLALVIVLCGASFADDIVRIGVMKFDAKAEGITSSQAGAITDALSRMLANSYSIAVVERDRLEAIGREQRLNMSGLVDSRTAAEIGRIAGLQYIVTGAVTHFGKNQDVQAFLGIAAEMKEDAEVTIDARLISVQTAEVVKGISETGIANNTSSAFVLGDVAKGGNLQGKNLQEMAISDAVARLGHRIIEAVTGEYPQVLSSGGNDIILSIGAAAGVKSGNLYKISANGSEVRDMRGNVVGRRTTPIAVVKVKEVQNDFSVANVVNKGGNASLVYRGDRIEAVSQKEANDMAKKKVFPKSRPRKPLGESTLSGQALDDRLDAIATEQAEADKPETVTPPPAVPATQEVSPAVNTDSPAFTSAGFTASGFTSTSSKAVKMETFSTDPAKVIASYSLSDGEKNSLLQQHKKAEKMKSRDEKFDRYVEIFRAFPSDYLAAYQAGRISIEIGKNARALEWAEKSLAVNPKYSPAKRLKQAAINKMK